MYIYNVYMIAISTSLSHPATTEGVWHRRQGAAVQNGGDHPRLCSGTSAWDSDRIMAISWVFSKGNDPQVALIQVGELL